jgi:hypothetical protein
VREYSFSVTEHDPDRPWVVRGHRRGVVELADDQDFFTWAHAEWPSDRFHGGAGSMAACAEVASASSRGYR